MHSKNFKLKDVFFMENVKKKALSLINHLSYQKNQFFKIWKLIKSKNKMNNVVRTRQ